MYACRDITSNQLTSLDGLEFPSSVLLLYVVYSFCLTSFTSWCIDLLTGLVTVMVLQDAGSECSHFYECVRFPGEPAEVVPAQELDRLAGQVPLLIFSAEFVS